MRIEDSRGGAQARPSFFCRLRHHATPLAVSQLPPPCRSTICRPEGTGQSLQHRWEQWPMPGGTEVAHHSMKHRSRSVGIWLRSGDLGQRQAHRSQLQSSLLRRGVGTRACSRCYHFFCFDHGGRRRTASSCRLEVLCHRSPPPHPRRLRPSSSDPMLQGLPAPPPPRQVRLLKPLLSADCSIPCLDHVRVRAQGMQGPATLLGVHVRWQVEVGAGEQAVERIDGAMVEVMGAELLHPPRADSWLLADEHRGARVLGNGDTPIGVRRCWRRRRGAGTFRTDELVNERSLPLSTFSAAG
ncbi:uncharacterized protein LOC119364378 isoform X3 [Triticum dicoccoides]|uniref:uncharacterized protein LOC119364378 isoform X3 n=1 Tax=Triticum dicoccoides TaxID=85692 RepID=UPI00188EC46E|nr:uncharacterized protein LOC119364378 isoform X3 [Triticum dicoccoides]